MPDDPNEPDDPNGPYNTDGLDHPDGPYDTVKLVLSSDSSASWGLSGSLALIFDSGLM